MDNINVNNVVLFASASAGIYYILATLVKKQERDKYAHIANLKRRSRDRANHQIFYKSNDRNMEKKVVNIKDAVELLEMYTSGELKRADVMLSLCRRACDVGRKDLNSVTEELYDEAYLEAKCLDDDMHPDFENLPMLGLPVSIKDCFHMKGCDSTLGTASRCFKPQHEDGLLVTILRRGGCIPFVRTNVSQLMQMPHSDNNVWGQSQNPYDSSRTPGGSSGGEAALISARCSFMGLGGDIGGSVRIPAHYCGIVGFKPTAGRVTARGSGSAKLNERDGQIVIVATSGPMARSVRDCALAMKTLVDLSPKLDCLVPPIPWKQEHVEKGNKRKLRVAVMMTDGWFEPFPVCKRAVQEAAEALVAAGHEIIHFKLPVNTAQMLFTYMRAMSADGNRFSLLRALEGEQVHASYSRGLYLSSIPNIMRPLLRKLLEFLGEKRLSLIFSSMKNGGLNVREYWENIADVKAIRSTYAETFSRESYDALLMPALGVTALPHGFESPLMGALSYAFLANLLNWPAGTVPVTTTRPDEEEYAAPASERDMMYDYGVRACLGSAGLPAGVQVMTPMWKDELCLFVMGEIEKHVNFSTKPNKYL